MTSLPDNNPKTAAGRKKPQVHAIPPSAILHLGEAMENGERRYGLMNWREKRVSSSVYYDAVLRHLLSWWDGEDRASDSKVHHLAHVMACVAILLDAIEIGNLNDDRPMTGTAAELIAAMQRARVARTDETGEAADTPEPTYDKPLPAWAGPECQPKPGQPLPRRGLRIIENALYFEDIRLVGLDAIPGLYSSAKDRLIEYVDAVSGHPAPRTD